jgi:hypothetical protein
VEKASNGTRRVAWRVQIARRRKARKRR